MMPRLVEVQSLQGHADRVWSVAWSPKGDMLASCSGDKTVRIWVPGSHASTAGGNSTSGTNNTCGTGSTDGVADRSGAVSSSMPAWRCSAVLEDTHTRTVRAAAWSPDGTRLALASFDAVTSVWRHMGGIWEQVATLEGHENEVKGVAWCPDGALLATCGRDKSVWVWEAQPGNDFECVDVKQGHTQDVKAVAWHPGGEILVSASYDDSIKLWAADGDEWSCAQTLAGSSAGGLGHTSTVWGVAFNASGSHMVSCSDDCTLKVWACEGSGQAPKWRCVCTISGYHTRAIYSVDWSHVEGCDYIVTGDGDDTIRVFEPATDEQGGMVDASSTAYSSWRQVLSVEHAHTADVNCVRWSPAMRGLLASAGDDGAVKLWLLEGA